ncbi:MAG: hypothetical protein AAB656_01535 [Patescibacteria group bacterium]
MEDNPDSLDPGKTVAGSGIKVETAIEKPDVPQTSDPNSSRLTEVNRPTVPERRTEVSKPTVPNSPPRK